MKILVRFNKNIAIPRQVKSFKLFDLGIVSTTIDDLLDSTTIEIDDQTLPILKINNSSFIEYYLINDLGLTPGYSYPYYTDDFMKEVTIGDLVLINNGQMGEENIQSDWNQINILADDFIKNKPELFSGDYNDLINTPALVTNHSELTLDDGTNPHGTTQADIGLPNVNNTSDANKPISTATQSALNGKANTVHSHVISDVNGLQTALNSKLDKVTTADVEKVYIKNADGTQGMKPVSEFKDVLEFANLASFPVTGETGKIYLTLDTNKTYLWSGSIYVQIGETQGVFLGSVIPTDIPTGTGEAFWIATKNGTYTNFGGLVVDLNSYAFISRDASGNFSISQTALDLTSYIQKNQEFPTWTATTFTSGSKVSYLGKFWKSNASTVGTDVPGASSKWAEELTGYKTDINLGVNPDLNTIVTAGTYDYIYSPQTVSWQRVDEKRTLIVVEEDTPTASANRIIYQYDIGNTIKVRERFGNSGTWTNWREQNQSDKKFIEGEVGWNIVDPKAIVSANSSLWNDGGLIIAGTSIIYPKIEVEAGVPYSSKSGVVTIWGYDADYKPLVRYPPATSFTFNSGTKFISIYFSNWSATNPLKFGKDIVADFAEPYAIKLKSEQVKGLESLDFVNVKAKTSSALELANAKIALTGGNYVTTKTGNANYTIQAKVKKPNMHNAVETVNIITINNGAELLKLELLNKLPTRDLGVPIINSEFRLTVGATVKSYNATNIINHLGGPDMFSIRRVDPAFTDYVGKTGPTTYDAALELTNYTLPQSELGWITKVESTGITLTKFNVTVASDVLTIGTTALETIAVPFNVNEKLDDYLKRLPALLGNRFEVKIQNHDVNLLCTELIACEIQMCRWFRPNKLEFRKADIPANKLANFIVDAFPVQIQAINKDAFDITIGYFDNKEGYFCHQVFINDFPIIKIRPSVNPNYTGTQTVSINATNFTVEEIQYNWKKEHIALPILNLTGHKYMDIPEYQSASLALTEIPFRSTLGRLQRLHKYMKDEGFEQITIKEFMDIKQGLKPWKKAYLWTMDDSSSIVTANGTFENISTHEKLRQSGIHITAGLNSASMEGVNGTTTQFEQATPVNEVRFFQQYGEMFNHSHFHFSHLQTSALQMIHSLKLHEQVVKDNALKMIRMFVLPFDDGTYATNRLIRSYGYGVVCAFLTDGYRGAIFKGSSDLCSPRINIDDLTSWEVLTQLTKVVGLAPSGTTYGYDEI